MLAAFCTSLVKTVLPFRIAVGCHELTMSDDLPLSNLRWSVKTDRNRHGISRSGRTDLYDFYAITWYISETAQDGAIVTMEH